jgi:hypothetical protein
LNASVAEAANRRTVACAVSDPGRAARPICRHRFLILAVAVLVAAGG